MQPAIRADGGADNFADVGKYGVENPGEGQHGSQAAEVAGGVIGDEGQPLVAAHEIGQKSIGDQERNQKEDAVLGHFFQDFFGGPGAVVQPSAGVCVAFDERFDLPKNHFHKNRLRAGPAAKHAAINHREERDEHNKCQQPDGDKVKILRPEHHPKHDEPPFEHVEQKQRVPIYPDERPGNEGCQQRPGHHRAPARVATRGSFWVKPVAPVLLILIGQVRAKIIVNGNRTVGGGCHGIGNPNRSPGRRVCSGYQVLR